LQLEGALTRRKMPAFNLSSLVAIPGAAFSGKSYSKIQIALECYSFDGNPTLTFKFLWSVNLLMETNAVALKGIYQLPCKFEIFWLFFEPYLIMHWSTCVFGPETQLHLFCGKVKKFC